MSSKKEEAAANTDNKIWVTLYESKSSLGVLGSGTEGFYVPKQANVNYLRTILMHKSNSKESIFLFAYGVILNNNETIGALADKFKHKIKGNKGLQIQIATLASF